jgi:transglutaminase-like putative cysteine protease
MSRLRIVHRTGFEYPVPASASYNEARMAPVADSRQYVLHSGLEIRPGAAQHAYLDYWGTQVATFEVLTEHQELSVTATSVVEVLPALAAGRIYAWEQLTVDARSSITLTELSMQTPLTTPHPEVVELALAAKELGRSPYGTAVELCRAIGERMDFVPGVTGVQTTAADAWGEHRGVCQDITHVAVGALRSIGIPARYVSGYLHPDPAAGIGVTVVGESHAWVEWFAGDWYGYDPTNQTEPGEFHVLVGRGRDYADVTPLRGVYAGADSSALFVRVEITQER